MGGGPQNMSSSELRRDISVWGCYMWGYADVGADIYTALGIVALAALGLTPLAFLMAGTVYALVGLCYAELASTYPVAGGGQYFTLRGLGDAWKSLEEYEAALTQRDLTEPRAVR